MARATNPAEFLHLCDQRSKLKSTFIYLLRVDSAEGKYRSDEDCVWRWRDAENCTYKILCSEILFSTFWMLSYLHQHLITDLRLHNTCVFHKKQAILKPPIEYSIFNLHVITCELCHKNTTKYSAYVNYEFCMLMIRYYEIYVYWFV